MLYLNTTQYDRYNYYNNIMLCQKQYYIVRITGHAYELTHFTNIIKFSFATFKCRLLLYKYYDIIIIIIIRIIYGHRIRDVDTQRAAQTAGRI